MREKLSANPLDTSTVLGDIFDHNEATIIHLYRYSLLSCNPRNLFNGRTLFFLAGGICASVLFPKIARF